jgi:signal transduction histidine kinase/ActR/RegA family two-component response regulator
MCTVFIMTESELIARTRAPGTLDFVVCVGLLYVIASSSQRIVPAQAGHLSMLCLTCDVIFITALVDLTGGVASELYPLYYLPILQACIRFSLRDALGAAILSVAFYGFLGYGAGFATDVPITVGVRVATFGVSAIFMAVFFAMMMRETRQKQAHISRIEALLERMGVLFEMGRLLSATLDFSSLLKRTASCAVRAVDAGAAGVLLVDPETGRASPAAVDRAGRRNAALPALEASWPLGQAAAERGDVLEIPGRRGERELKQRTPEGLRSQVESAVAVPFGRDDQRLGVLQVVNKRSGEAFSAEDTDMLGSIGAQAAVAVENARLFDELHQRVEELEHAHAQLAQSEKLSALGGLISGIAHELNNPLTAVLGFSELLMRKPSSEKLPSRLKLVHEAALRCKHIVGDLLLFARSARPTRTSVDINEIVRSALAMQQGDLDTAEVEVSLALDESLPRVLADGPQMEQVVVNLIQNARQAMSKHPPPRRLQLTTRPGDGCVRLEVRDSGPGIRPADVKRIFEPFFTTRQPGEGTGLGLSVSYGIVDAHGGSITAGSVVPTGASFVVDLPLQPDDAAEHAAADQQDAAATSALQALVLIVDDDDAVREVVAEGLVEAGCEVEQAADGEAAWQKVRQGRYDALIVDVRMPHMDGPGLYAELQRGNSDMARRVIFITGDTISPETAEFLDGVAAPRLTKPFVLEDLVAAVRAVTGAAAA